ncbi:hypothetical protein CCHR01_14819 [Colletotrichum chrysophilum]|uniref:Uncharacterized protein n=1 Tax=Colletotrichum chrysophilum TaxID=1836956 RepID=A0AAD9A9G5_9PEZI|nr:hypothetical protein K456DRAFT_1687479 [Colletotrichum gloeosporioides 23]KAK1842557.1 hypothetical protein CCHR01_14819 [Colletotrichum chrysophilum]
MARTCLRTSLALPRQNLGPCLLPSFVIHFHIRMRSTSALRRLRLVTLFEVISIGTIIHLSLQH